MTGNHFSKWLVCGVLVFSAGVGCKLLGKDDGASTGTPPTPSPTPDDPVATEAVYGLEVSGPSTGLVTHSCLKLTIKAKNLAGQLIRAESSTAFSLSAGSAHAGFYINADCSTALSLNSHLLSAGQSSVDLYFRDLYPESVTVTPSSSGIPVLTAWTGSLSPVAISNLYLDMDQSPPDSGTGNHTSGSCHGPYFITAIGGGGTVILSTTASTAVSFTYGGGGANGDARFYLANTCDSGALTAVDIPANSDSSGNFYLKGTTDTDIYWSISSPSGDGANSFTFQ